MTHDEEIQRLERAMIDLQSQLDQARAFRVVAMAEMEVTARQLAVLESACRRAGLSWPPKDEQLKPLRRFEDLWKWSARLIGDVAGAIAETNRIRDAHTKAMTAKALEASHEGRA